MSEVHDNDRLSVLADQIDGWLAQLAVANPAVEAVDREDDDQTRWYVRLRGDEKEHITVWMTLGQRTLRYEAYVMPAPQENVAQVYELALRRNEKLVGAHFAIGVEDALFLRGELPVTALCAEEVDRIVGSIYAYAEQSFPALIRLGFASHFQS
ncbi:MAG TPA: YbjN domain-containing protein [Ilumatobacteraceae bacterium]|nr:YbjN domain-containing protein [Ilumatobacteraceae bacterium]